MTTRFRLVGGLALAAAAVLAVFMVQNGGLRPAPATPTPAPPSPVTASATAMATIAAVHAPEPYPPPLPRTPQTATPYPAYPSPTRTRAHTPTLAPEERIVVARLTMVAAATAMPADTSAPTATPLPPLDPALEVMIYAVRGERWPELMRLQVDSRGRPVGTPQAFSLTWDRQAPGSIPGLYPSPAGRYAMIPHPLIYGPLLALLDTRDWSMTPLKHELPGKNWENVPTFLDWSPDGRSLLMSGSQYPSLNLLSLDTREWRVLPALPGYPAHRGGLVTFSPDGTALATTTNDELWNYGQKSEVWIVPLDGSVPRRVDYPSWAGDRVQWLAWSPRGDALALAVQHHAGDAETEVLRCALWLVPLGGDAPRPLGDVAIDAHADLQLEPLWEPDGAGIVLVRSMADAEHTLWGEFRSNLYRVDVDSGEAVALTAFEDTAVVAPHWAPGGALTFATGNVEGPPLPVWWLRLDAEGRAVGDPEMMAGPILTGGGRQTAAGMVWVPAGD